LPSIFADLSTTEIIAANHSLPLRSVRRWIACVVQSPMTTLADDVAATRLMIAQAPGTVDLVGHSCGAVVITEAGTDPKVAALA
jgi:hypothetical protein